MIFQSRIDISSILGGQTGCIDRSDRFVQNLQLGFCLHRLSNMKIILHNCNNMSILFPWYISYNKFIKGRNNIEALVKILVMLIDSCCLSGINRLSMEKTTTLPVRPHSPSLSSRNDNLVTTFQGELWIWILETAFLLFRRERVSDLML